MSRGRRCRERAARQPLLVGSGLLQVAFDRERCRKMLALAATSTTAPISYLLLARKSLWSMGTANKPTTAGRLSILKLMRMWRRGI